MSTQIVDERGFGKSDFWGCEQGAFLLLAQPSSPVLPPCGGAVVAPAHRFSLSGCTRLYTTDTFGVYDTHSATIPALYMQ